MKKIYFLMVTTLVLLGVQKIIAQNTVAHQVIVCSGGNISDPEDFVTVAAFLPATGITTVFDTIYTQSVQNVIVENEVAFVAAQDSIVKYDLNTYNRLAAIEAPGVHKLAIRNETLIATFWYPLTSGFVKTFSTSDLSSIYTFEEVSDEADGILVFPGNLYTVVAVPGGWASTSGKMAWLDIDNNNVVGESDLNEYGHGVSYFISYDTGIPNHMAVTKTPWGDSTFNTYGFTVIGEPTGVNTYDGVMQGFTGQNNTILYAQINDGIGKIDLENHILDENLIIDPQVLTISSSTYDSVNNLFYVSTTDYFSTGEGTIYNIDGEEIGSYEAGISPEAIAIDYRNNTIIEEKMISGIRIYPNPANRNITIRTIDNAKFDQIKITDISGRMVYKKTLYSEIVKTTIDISYLRNGLYFVNLIGDKQITSNTFIKN